VVEVSAQFALCRTALAAIPAELEVEWADPALGRVGVAVRRNPKRVQLLVTESLAKHVPVEPAVVLRAVNALAQQVGRLKRLPSDTLVVGLAETATGIAQLLAERLAPIDFIHSTRRQGLMQPWHVAFEEVHSHAASHVLAPDSPEFLRGRRVLVVVDDELTTGLTIASLVRAIGRFSEIERVVVACLVDARDSFDPGAVAELVEDGVELDVVQLARLHLRMGDVVDVRLAGEDGILQAGGRSETARSVGRSLMVPAPPVETWRGIRLVGGAAVGDGYLSTLTSAIRRRLEGLGPASSVHILGVEEQIALPVQLAHALSDAGYRTTVSSTTSSPAVVLDDANYPLRTSVEFGVGSRARRAYNLPVDAEAHVIVPDSDGRVDDALVRALPGEVVVLRWE
jgi:pyrimidine operon attenuation protein/uracil phosphoribosyltransferase